LARLCDTQGGAPRFEPETPLTKDERAWRPNLGCQPPHKFHVGEIVNFRPVRRNIPGGYEVIKQLLHNGREFEYRIKSANEEHEPVAGEREKAS
jgi:hypothetical protein